jgi:hypothetical protein
MRHKALTVRAPWAWFIATGRKPVELRKQRTHYRGPLLICCGLAESDAPLHPSISMREHDAARDALLRGHALCLVDVVDCRPATADDSHAACTAVDVGAWAWVLANPRPVERVAVTGKQGFFWVEL